MSGIAYPRTRYSYARDAGYEDGRASALEARAKLTGDPADIAAAKEARESAEAFAAKMRECAS